MPIGMRGVLDSAHTARRCGLKLGLVFAAVALLAASSAAAGEYISDVQLGDINFETVVEFGRQAQPVTIDQSSQVNIADVIQITRSGAPTATIVQTGTDNVAQVFQRGASTSATITQFGAMNSANVHQVGNTTNSFLTQIGNLNTGAITQIGRSNSSVVFQSGH
jgi:minor curlin subunit